MKLLLTLLALALCSCSDMFVDEGKARPNNENLPDLTAAFVEETETRTYVENNKYLRWHEDDRITAFYGNTLNRQYKFNGLTGDNSGTFSLVPDGMLGTGNTFDHVYALYPYNTSARISDEGVITLTLPAMQTYAENSFGNGANTMIAVTENLEDTFLAFKNVCGYLKLKLYDPDGGGLKSVTIKGNNNEKIAGVATATVKFGEAPVITMTEEATNSVTLDCGEGILLGTTVETATELWIVLPETIFTKGITIIATDVDGGTFEKSTSNEVVISRNTIQPMAAVEVIYVNSENCKIYYEATKKLVPYRTNVFGANIISNEWNETTGKGVITFDGEVTQIGDWAFFNDDWYERSVYSLTIPESVTHIGVGALYQRFLDNIFIPKNVKSIEEGALAYNSNIYFSNPIPIEYLKCFNDGDYDITVNRIYVPYQNLKEYRSKWSNYRELIFGFDYDSNTIYLDDLTKIKYTTTDNCKLDIDYWKIVAHKFDNGEGTIYMPCPSEFNTDINSSYFRNCESLKSITIPDNVTKIGGSAFSGCSSLTSITIPDSVTTIGDYAFYGCSSLTSITIPDSVTTIGDYAFYGCTGELIVNCNIPDASSSSDGVFYNSKFTKVTIGDAVTSIGKDAFYNCWSLTSVTIPDSVTSIGDYAFYGCSSLTSVTIPDSVTTIGERAFVSCSSLTSVTIGDSVTTIRDFAFYDCDSLTSVYISDLSAWCKIDFGYYYANPLNYAKNLYLNNELVTDLVIPSDITEIKSYAFYNCSSLTSVTIGDSVTSIGGYAFYGCSSLTSVTIPDSVTTIGGSAFSGCTGELVVNCNIPSVSSSSSGPFYGSKFTSITIGDSVTSIGDYAFYGCDECESITIGRSVTTINNAFRYFDVYSNLKRVDINDLSAWCKIDFTGWDSNPLDVCEADLYLCGEKLRDLVIPSDITIVKTDTFQGCNSIESVTIPDNVTTIEEGAFRYCLGLTSAVIGNGIASINKETFRGCSNLTTVSIPNSVVSIGYDAFSGCGLIEVTIPDSVERIGTYAFLSCTRLKTVIIGSGVTSIGDQAFNSINGVLNAIYCKPIIPPTIGDAITARYSITVYVPEDSEDVYKTSAGWSNYAYSIVGYDF